MTEGAGAIPPLLFVRAQVHRPSANRGGYIDSVSGGSWSRKISTTAKGAWILVTSCSATRVVKAK